MVKGSGNGCDRMGRRYELNAELNAAARARAEAARLDPHLFCLVEQDLMSPQVRRPGLSPSGWILDLKSRPSSCYHHVSLLWYQINPWSGLSARIIQ